MLMFHYLLFVYVIRTTYSSQLREDIHDIKMKPAEDDGIEAYCFLNYNGIVYDLLPLYDLKQDYSFQNKDKEYFFNFCKFANKKCRKDNTYISQHYIIANETNVDDCYLLSGSNPVFPSRWRVNLDGNKFSIELPPGDRCESDKKKFYTTIYELTCDNKVEKLAIDNTDEVGTKRCINVVKMRSKFGNITINLACPDFKTFGLSLLVKENAIPFGVFLIICGSYFCFLGYRYKSATRILTGCAFVLFVTIYIIMYHVPLDLKSLYFWLVIMGCVLVGLGIGCLISAYPWIASTILGGLIGFIFAEIVFQAVVYAASASPTILYWVMVSVASILGVYLGSKYPKPIFIVSSAFLGGYSIIRVF
jgi:hypothetical protein